MNRRRIILILWSFAFLVNSLASFYFSINHKDTYVFNFYLNLIFSFPLGSVLATISMGLLFIFSDIETTLAGDFFTYTLMFLGGYIQWFVLLPRISRRIAREKS